MIDAKKLVRAMPQASEPWLTAMVEIMPTFGIEGLKREAAFLGQMRYECADFTNFLENLNYKDPARIALIFRRAFDLDGNKVIDQAEINFAKNYVRQPEKLANRAYANRFGNGDEASGDGWKYRGRGPTQLTFKDNYAKASFWAGVNLVQDPDEMLVPRIGCKVACGYWRDHGCNSLADLDNHLEITRQINPGLAGLKEREALVVSTSTILQG